MPNHNLTTVSEQRRHSTGVESETEKAWHLLWILLSLRRPAAPEELASRCRLFDATEESVLRLCSIPESPICATEEGLVTVAVVTAEEEEPMAKRRLLFRIDEGEEDELGNACQLDLAKGNSNSNNESALGLLRVDSNAEFSSFPMRHSGHEEDADVWPSGLLCEDCSGYAYTSNLRRNLLKTEVEPCTVKPVQNGFACRGEASFLDLNFPPPSLNQDALAGDERSKHDTDSTSKFSLEEAHNTIGADTRDSHSCKVFVDQLNQDAEPLVRSSVKEGFVGFGAEAGAENFVLSENFDVFGEAQTHFLDSRITVNGISLDKDENRKKVETKPDNLNAEYPCTKKQPAICSKVCLSSQERLLVESPEDNEVVNTPQQQNQCKSAQRSLSVEQELKKNIKETNVDSTSITPKLERINLPHFADFIIEEEEGSGGYGTVYRAQRKIDEKRFAIKCPHVKAHKQHVDNERKMLERFGGRNFIIKYEGSFKSGDRECFILEHVEHDRPEVLKKKIELFELQWYGYCMFRALACMHKQGVVHRDVKPGNFLFSQKQSKGYLIDFNLAMDVHQKYTTTSKLVDKSKSNRHVSFALPNREKKFVRGDLVDSKKAVDPKRNMRKRAQTGPLINDWTMSVGNIYKSQHVDGSGITSAKDVTDKTPSAERVREPLPSLGRKELISLAQDAILSPNHDVVKSPASKRKRIAATPGKIPKLISPMSLHFTGAAVSSASLLKSKVVSGDGKQKREGPCAGTKGFRAPEVLFRSLHQGHKVDVWSAGVTLLYLMIGRIPFTGDPEQNIKDIAKLKGSEDLWEVAKLHDRESSFPVELFDVKHLTSVKLQTWCKAHTKKPEFLSCIPRSLFDLVDKCLTVNPRLRISSEEALSHEFFAPCHEILRKHRMSRRNSMGAQNVVNEQS